MRSYQKEHYKRKTVASPDYKNNNNNNNNIYKIIRLSITHTLRNTIN